MSNTTLRERVGQCMIVGLEGATLTATEAAWLRMLQPAGVILFARNIVNAQQTRELLHAAQSVVRTPLFTCVDLEGGTVDRLRAAFAPSPSAASVASLRDNKAARTHGRLIGEACVMFGFNVTFAPVLDLALTQSASVMGTRTAGETGAEVTAYARQFLKGLSQSETMGCGKHFPGLGGGALDSHHTLPLIARNWEQLSKEDMKPYRELRGDLDMVMVSHAAYPLVTRDAEPADLSPFWIRKALRRTCGYKGLVLSDDLEMQAVLTRGVENVAPAALMAGVDVLLVCHRADLVLGAYEAALYAAEHSWALRDHIQEATERAAKTKRRLRRATASEPSQRDEHKLRERALAFHAEIARTLDHGK